MGIFEQSSFLTKAAELRLLAENMNGSNVDGNFIRLKNVREESLVDQKLEISDG